MSRILIVEDETHLAEGLRFNLEAEGHSVHISGKGEEALDLLLKDDSDSKRSYSMSCCRARTALRSRANCAKRKTTFRY